MNTTHKIAGVFAAVLAVLALGGTLQAAVADSIRPSAAQVARALAPASSQGVMLHGNVAGERTSSAKVSG